MANCNECKRQDDCPGLNYCVHEPREMRADLRAEIAAAVAAERERCAKVCDLHSRLTWNDDRKAQSRVLAAEIRRGA